MPTASPDFLAILQAFARAEVDAILVGGVAAIVHGSSMMTEDVDLVYRTDSENVARILGVLQGLDARYRDPAGRMIRPTLERLRDQRTNLLTTSLGPLDLLQSIDGEAAEGKGYEELSDHGVLIDFEVFRFRVASLVALIESKRAAGRPKDLLALPILESLLEGSSQGR